jgi:gamma-glutamylcyclotransferase (GGCT)/AIG2-like uncharacterized protein YtfP
MRPPRTPADVVSGELYRLRQPSKTLKVLDEYEEHYVRELQRATLVNGPEFPAWVYMYRQFLPEDSYVASGEWLPEDG